MATDRPTTATGSTLTGTSVPEMAAALLVETLVALDRPSGRRGAATRRDRTLRALRRRPRLILELPMAETERRTLVNRTVVRLRAENPGLPEPLLRMLLEERGPGQRVALPLWLAGARCGGRVAAARACASTPGRDEPSGNSPRRDGDGLGELRRIHQGLSWLLVRHRSMQEALFPASLRENRVPEGGMNPPALREGTPPEVALPEVDLSTTALPETALPEVDVPATPTGSAEVSQPGGWQDPLIALMRREGCLSLEEICRRLGAELPDRETLRRWGESHPDLALYTGEGETAWLWMGA
ncbi:MAG: hypothetical protein HQL57_02285 [Magnetococcales bacterium]|nr:hypothetical protein [Magnetococcales bacterium]MBF0155994.1 hypothetical protein [Magnetococcales bacterium]